MKMTIIGPGAMGCLLAVFLAKSKEELWLLDRDPRRAKEMSDEGIKMEGISGTRKVKIPVTSRAEEIGVCDVVIICVKSYDTQEAIKRAEILIGPNTSVLTLQNGVGNVEIIGEIVGRDKVIGGITALGATLLGTGHIRHAGWGETIIGRVEGKVLSSVREIAAVFNKVGLKTKISKDINSLIWSKLIINVGINALTAITRLNNGRLIEYDGTKEILRSAVAEAVKVAKKKRIKIIYDDPIQKVEAVCKATASNVSSMLQDVLKQKKTEVDFINGVICRQGRSLGIPMPVNAVLLDLVRTIESSYDKQISSFPLAL